MGHQLTTLVGRYETARKQQLGRVLEDRVDAGETACREPIA